MRMIKPLGLLLAIVFICTGCGGSLSAIASKKQAELKGIEKPDVSSEDKLYMASNTAGVQLLQKIAAGSEGNNTIFSPISLSTILAVLQNGADGKTREEINTIINPEQLSTEELNEKYCSTINHLINAGYKENGNKTTLIEIVNSLWIHEKLRVKDSFLKASNTYYGAEAYNVNFEKESTIRDMNGWIEDKTHGRIQNCITGVTPLPAMVAFNALYFNGKWQSPFDKSNTQREDFYLSNGKITKVEMMNGDKWIHYYEDEQIQAGESNYYGCSMLVILPKGNIGEYVHNLNYSGIQKVYSNSENIKVKIKFPKFNYKQKNELNDHLKSMGLESAFDSRNADFTKIADRAGGFNLFVSDISQECFIAVDEEGTEAAALTSVTLHGGAPKVNIPPEFYINKPFVFAIRDNKTGLILFIGKVENPSDNK